MTDQADNEDIVCDVKLDLTTVHALFAKKGKGLKHFARAAGLDPAEDFKNISLNGIPLGNMYIGEMDFSGSDLTGTGITSATQGVEKAIFTGAFFGDHPSLDPDVIAFNKRLRDAPNLAAAQNIFGNRPQQVRPDVVTYTTLIRRSPDMHTMREWLHRMVEAGVAPNAHTFTTILNRTETLDEAQHWLQRMVEAGVAPNAHTFTTIL
ncbi:MAG: hypothetical protein P1U37_05480, partial [Minwuia sp.]|nr:hypothetical protein [Minwuia sp.]